jgi:CheY-like chemotaxis protein
LVSTANRARLAAIVAERNRPQKHVVRARIVLHSADRVDVAEVARRALLGRPAVWRWQQRFAEAIDEVVSDLRMPDLDGPSLWRELSATRPDLAARMLFLTGDTLSGTARAFLHEANAPVLDKPLDLDELRRRIGELAGIAAAAR